MTEILSGSSGSGSGSRDEYRPTNIDKRTIKRDYRGGSQTDYKLSDKTVCIAGLGYVGLPLALAFSRHLPTIGFDVDAGKIRELFLANDNQSIAFTDNPEDIGNADFIIIAVPTPVTKSKDPDLSYIESAARTTTAAPSVMCNG